MVDLKFFDQILEFEKKKLDFKFISWFIELFLKLLTEIAQWHEIKDRDQKHQIENSIYRTPDRNKYW